MNIEKNRSHPGARTQYFFSGKPNHHIDFFCKVPYAKQVFLVGDFNHWNPTACSMQRMPDECWTVSLELPHGSYQYCFLVDGQRVLDPNSSGTVRDEHNNKVSLLLVS